MKHFKQGLSHLILLSSISIVLSCNNNSGNADVENKLDTVLTGNVTAELTDAPAVPKQLNYTSPKKVIVQLDVIEKVMKISDSTEYTFWTFGGHVPGKFIRVRQGDLVDFTLHNMPDSKLSHNIDLHAVTGPGGGADATATAPGQSSHFQFRALNPGLFVYHCATGPVGMHIANGMYGLILVEPEGGLPPVDKEYYVMQGDFYTKGKNGAPGLQPFDMQKAVDEHPDYVVFNGKVNALTGEKALTAKVGETVRLFVGNGGPNLISSFHVIGEIFDNVYVEGGELKNSNVQTTLIPSGGSAIVEFKVEVPGTYILVDHSLSRTFNKGSLGMLNVTGDPNKLIYSGTLTDGIYKPEGGTIQNMPDGGESVEPKAANLDERISFGKTVYARTCIACHQENGAGLPNAFPPLAQSDFLNQDPGRAIETVLKGRNEEITVNGKKYNGIMPAQVLSDEEIANVLSYVYASWGNKKQEVTPAMVTQKRGH